MSRLPVARSRVRLSPDPSRVIAKPFAPGEYTPAAGAAATKTVLQRVLDLPQAEVEATLAATYERYRERHPDLGRMLEESFERVAGLLDGMDLTPARRALVGAYFIHEYAIEAAALTNPSIVVAPDQTDLPEGHLRFVLSLRAIGEGHRSSIVFRSGVIDSEGHIDVDRPHERPLTGAIDAAGSLVFPASTMPDQRVIYPREPDEQNGVEDARFTRFTDDDGRVRYLATFTAFDGVRIRSRMLETDDFRVFQFMDLEGEAAQDKGMALFPRRVGGRYAALSRFDDESNHLVFSDDLGRWDSPVRLQAPKHAWELTKLGNGGSPIETDRGWLVITHGVGPLREYALGAILLDIDDPSVVLGILDEPLLTAAEDERDGYVPNVVYSCGSLLHAGRLVLPYGLSDRGTGFASVSLEALLERLR